MQFQLISRDKIKAEGYRLKFGSREEIAELTQRLLKSVRA